MGATSKSETSNTAQRHVSRGTDTDSDDLEQMKAEDDSNSETVGTNTAACDENEESVLDSDVSQPSVYRILPPLSNFEVEAQPVSITIHFD